jgi:hypothetical protein
MKDSLRKQRKSIKDPARLQDSNRTHPLSFPTDQPKIAAKAEIWESERKGLKSLL